MIETTEVTEQVLRVICDAVEQMNRELQYESLDTPGRDTVIWEDVDGIDSISLVDFAVSLESQIREEFGRSVVLTDERAFASASSPFKSVGSLTDFIVSELARRG